MRQERNRGGATAAVALLLIGVPAAASQATGAPAAVHPTDPAAHAVFARAVAESPTVARLVRELEAGNVIVTLRLSFMERVAADTRWIAASGAWRFLLVRLDVLRGQEDQVVLLGHELQHAAEVARAPEVRDSTGLEQLMARIGRRTGRGLTFETDEAVEAGRQVERELRARLRQQ